MQHQRAQQLRPVVDRGHDLHVVRGQQPDQAVPQERQVLAKDNSHGSSIVTWVGPPGGLVTATIPSKARSRRSMPCSPPPGRGWAPPAPLSPTIATSLPSSYSSCAQARFAPLCLTTLASASATAK